MVSEIKLVFIQWKNSSVIDIQNIECYCTRFEKKIK